MVRRFLHIIFWVVLVAVVIVALAFFGERHNETKCSKFDLRVENQGYDALTSPEELSKLIISATDTLTRKSIGEIEPYDIHLILARNPYVKNADINIGIDGAVEINVLLRQAIVRIMNRKGTSYYIDSEGWLIPVNQGFPSRVLIVSGNVKDGDLNLKNQKIPVDSLPAGSMINKIYKLASYVHQDEFLRRLITQVHIDGSGDLELIPVVGEYTIVFGGFENMEEKFENLATYYREGAGKAGWIDYSSIDLRYKNQVICSK